VTQYLLITTNVSYTTSCSSLSTLKHPMQMKSNFFYCLRTQNTHSAAGTVSPTTASIELSSHVKASLTLVSRVVLIVLRCFVHI